MYDLTPGSQLKTHHLSCINWHYVFKTPAGNAHQATLPYLTPLFRGTVMHMFRWFQSNLRHCTTSLDWNTGQFLCEGNGTLAMYPMFFWGGWMTIGDHFTMVWLASLDG